MVDIPCIELLFLHKVSNEHILLSGCDGMGVGTDLSPGDSRGGPYSLLTCSLSLGESSVFLSIPVG